MPPPGVGRGFPPSRMPALEPAEDPFGGVSSIFFVLEGVSQEEAAQAFSGSGESTTFPAMGQSMMFRLPPPATPELPRHQVKIRPLPDADQHMFNHAWRDTGIARSLPDAVRPCCRRASQAAAPTTGTKACPPPPPPPAGEAPRAQSLTWRTQNPTRGKKQPPAPPPLRPRSCPSASSASPPCLRRRARPAL